MTPSRLKNLLMAVMVSLTINLTESAQADDIFGDAHSFNAWVLHDFSSGNSSAGGKIAAGNNISLGTYGVARSIEVPADSLTLIAGGDLVFVNGSLHAGSGVSGGDISGVSSSVINGLQSGATITGNTPSGISFAQQFTEFERIARRLAIAQANGTVEAKWGGLYLSGDCESAIQVFNIDGQLAFNANTFSVDCVPENATLVFNIDGTDVGLTNIGLDHLEPWADRTLFNFHQANTLKLNGVGVQGTVLAPNAAITANNGRLNGSVYSRSWSGSMALVDNPFNGDIDALVAKPNFAPIIFPGILTEVTVGQDVIILINAVDPEGEPLSYKLILAPEGMTVDENGIIFWSGTDNNTVGNFGIQYEVSDGRAVTIGNTFVAVKQVNRPPSLVVTSPINISVSEVGVIRLQVSDPDGDDVTITATGLPAFAKLTDFDLILTPGPDDIGTYQVGFGISDGTVGVIVPATINVTGPL